MQESTSRLKAHTSLARSRAEDDIVRFGRTLAKLLFEVTRICAYALCTPKVQAKPKHYKPPSISASYVRVAVTILTYCGCVIRQCSLQLHGKGETPAVEADLARIALWCNSHRAFLKKTVAAVLPLLHVQPQGVFCNCLQINVCVLMCLLTAVVH